MSEFDIKIPTTQAEMDELRKSLREEISDDDLDAVVGGNDTQKGKGKGREWICPGCGATVWCKSGKDASKHATVCPGNPFRED